MTYGSYSGPNKENKGHENGACNRRSCQKEPAIWYNHGSFSWYCTGCKNQIYDEPGRRFWAQDFPNAKHPMFETREMLNKRNES